VAASVFMRPFDPLRESAFSVTESEAALADPSSTRYNPLSPTNFSLSLVAFTEAVFAQGNKLKFVGLVLDLFRTS